MFARRTAWNLAPNRFSVALEKHRAAGRELLDLTASNPTQIGIRFDGLAILKALVDLRALEYHPEPKGLLAARDAVVAYYRERVAAGSGGSCGSDGDPHLRQQMWDRTSAVDPAQVILTTSTSEAYSFVFRLLCDPDDELLVPTPSYPLFEFLAGLQDVRLAPYELVYDHGWQIDFRSLEKALTERSRAVLVVHPNNPTGGYVHPGEMQRLSGICRKLGLALIADEVFLDFAHDGNSRPTFAANQSALTFTLSGLSKISGMPQMKFAWIVVSGPGEQRREALSRFEVIADTYLSMNAPVQLAAPEFLRQRVRFQEELMQRIRANLAELDRQLGEQKLCRRLEVQGGWYALLRVPVTRSDEDLAIEILEQHGVLVHPGHFYDFSADGYLVLSLITPEKVFSEALGRLLGLF